MDQKVLGQLIRCMETLRDLDSNMPVTQCLTLLVIAWDEGISFKELAQKAEIGMASASRYVSAFSKATGPNGPGMGLVVATEDPMERRKKNVVLTAKGRALLNKLTGD